MPITTATLAWNSMVVRRVPGGGGWRLGATCVACGDVLTRDIRSLPRYKSILRAMGWWERWAGWVCGSCRLKKAGMRPRRALAEKRAWDLFRLWRGAGGRGGPREVAAGVGGGERGESELQCGKCDTMNMRSG